MSIIKIKKNSDTVKIAVIILKFEQSRVMRPKGEYGMANNVDPDQSAHSGAVWSGSTLFAQTCLSKNLGSLP